jgi:hypothetical protein
MSTNPTKTASPTVSHAHSLVLDTAKEMAFELYEHMMRDNEWYARLKELNPGLTPKQLSARFVLRIAPTLVEQARATLAGMLARPIDEKTKESIMNALLLDNTLVRGRRAGGHIRLN